MKRKIFSIVIAAFCMVLLISLAACSSGVAQTLPTEAAVGDIITLGGAKWRVLEVSNGNTLILSEKILFKKAYNTMDDPVSWEECDLRQYLNGEFFETTFSAEEQELILETSLVNHDSPWFLTPGGNDTKDKVFLLSLDEVNQYFGDSGLLANKPSGATYITDQFDEVRKAQTTENETAWWWLRSPGLYYFACEANHTCAAIVNADGGLGVQGTLVNNVVGGVRPALWLKL